MAILGGFRKKLANYIFKQDFINSFNEAFLWAVGGGYTEYDRNAKSYIEEGYNINPIVYSVINQMSTKTASIPIYVRKVEDKKALRKLQQLRSSTGRNLTIQQKTRELILQSKAFKKDELDFPLEQPNPNQSWAEFLGLYKTFLRTTGNVYIYLLRTEEGRDAGTPVCVYLLPSHLMQIVVKKGTDLMSVENPVQSYMLIEGNSWVDFEAEDVIHIKNSNPNYSSDGEHLYGLSPLASALKNIQASNTGLDLNIKTLKSGGAFGFIHGKQTPITADQAAEIKERLSEMNSSPDDLSKIAGISAEVGFTRLSLTSDELRPFDYLQFDQKQICNVLGWSDSLLNNDDGGKYDKQLQERKRVITDNIVPDLDLLVEKLNKYFLPLFKGYENTYLEYDIMELPEMQDDMAEMSNWLYQGLDRAVFNRDEIRVALKWDAVESEEMQRYTVSSDIISLKEALDNDFSIGE